MYFVYAQLMEKSPHPLPPPPDHTTSEKFPNIPNYFPSPPLTSEYVEAHLSESEKRHLEETADGADPGQFGRVEFLLGNAASWVTGQQRRSAQGRRLTLHLLEGWQGLGEGRGEGRWGRGRRRWR